VEEGLTLGGASFIVAIATQQFSGSHFQNIFAEVCEEPQLRVLREDGVHVLYVAHSAIDIMRNGLPSLPSSLLAQGGRTAVVGIEVVLDRGIATKKRYALLCPISEAAIHIVALRLAKSLRDLLSKKLLYVLRP
jgi:hypothetical protein